MTKINIWKRFEIIKEIENGLSQRQVANKLLISRRSVQEIFKKYESKGVINDLPRCGRPSIISLREKRNLVRLSKKNPYSTPSELRKEWKTGISPSISTVKRILSKYGLHGHVAAKKPFLNKAQIKKRFNWAASYGNWTQNQWNKVIFSDETKIELFQKRRKYIRRLDKTRFHINHLIKTVKFGGKSLLCWGAIKFDGSRSLIRCEDTLNSAKYQDVLKEGLLPFYDSTETFIQDGAPCHRSHSTMDFLEKNLIMYVDDWPPQSPDINIIENIWSIVKEKVSKRISKTLDELWTCFQEEWDSIPNETIQKLYQSIPRRLAAIKKCKGGCTKY